MAKAKSNGKLSREEFTKLAIARMRDDGQAGILARKSGYFGGFTDYFGEEPYTYTPRKGNVAGHYSGWLIEAIKLGKFEGHPTGSGTYAIFLKGEMPKRENPIAVANKAKLLKLVTKAAKS